jgi:hypothetical protein
MKKIIVCLIPFILFAEERLSSILIADGFKKPVFVTSYPNDSRLLYVVEQAGVIKIIKNGKKIKTPFFDINKNRG